MVRVELEVLGQAALALDASAKRHRHQRAGQVVSPLVIGANEALRTAAIGLAEFGAAMGAAILEGMDAAVLIPRHDDRNAADI